MWTDIILGLGVIFVSALIATSLITYFVPRHQWIARLAAFLLLVWLVGSVWLGLSFLELLGLYVVLVLVLEVLRRYR